MSERAREMLRMLRVGEASSIYGARLAVRLGVKDSKSVQAIAMELRRMGFIIGSTGKGFFICETREEADTYILSLRGRIAGTQKTITALASAVDRKWGPQAGW